MGDKEPRRRKKQRKDSQKKDDVRSEDQFFSTIKSESRDSDQEVEEETVSHGHHHGGEPSSIAKILFVILFSGLVVFISFIFISLHGADRGPVDIFDASHGDHHAEELHDEHLEGTIQEDHEHGHDHHEESEVKLEDFISGMSSLFSFSNEEAKDIESQDIPPEDDDKDDNTDDDAQSYSIAPEIDQGMLEEYIEDATTDSIEEPSPSEMYPETTISSSIFEAETSYYNHDYSEPEEVTPSTQPEEFESTLEPFTYDEPDDMPTTVDSGIDDDDDDEPDSFSIYERADITNDDDYRIRDQLDELDDLVRKSPAKALPKCDELLQKHPQSPRLHYARAQSLDSLAEVQRSNKQLEEAIAWYQKTMSSQNVPQKLYLLAGKRAADRLRFRGFSGKSVKLLLEMSDKFPLDVDVKNQVAVGYLLIGQNKLAKMALQDVLKIAPDSGFAKVHLGFIMKTDESNYEEAIKYLSEGIATKEAGVIDGRFYFHLGDALHRTGKNEEALKVYEDAVKEGLFLSVYQRSLYNVDNLTGKPWWDPHSTRYAPDIKILERNWKTIKDEALSLLSDKYAGFMPEAEGLQEKGDWKQLELFARGRKLEKNCQKAPKTCALISQIPDAANCKRGQVKFSIMHPGTHVWAHTGPTNCRLRAHLGLVVPGGASIRVAGEMRNWEEGKVILFDDSFEHEVWHNGSTYRLVLIVDFWHPELTAYQKRTLTPI